MLFIIILSVGCLDFFSASSTINVPLECQLLNPVHDSGAETALINYYNNRRPFNFSESNFFQPQCLLCEIFRREVCFGYRGSTFYGVKNGDTEQVELITNLPYIYSLAQKVGASLTVVSAIVTVREDIIIPYRTLLRFKVINHR